MQIMEIKVWILGGVVLALVTIVGFFGRQAFAIIKGLLNDMLEELKKLTGTAIKHDERIKNLEETKHDHESRIRKIESRRGNSTI
jgi:hypothetical protein